MSEIIKKHQEIKIPHANETEKKKNRSQSYFGTLTKKQIIDLHFKYRQDFELFDYSIEPYLSFAKDE